MKPGEIYWNRLKPYLEKIDIYNGPKIFLESYSLAPMVERTLFATHFCQSEIRNGGLCQFFSNSTGVLAPEAETGFLKMGLPEYATIIHEAISFFGAAYPRDREERVSILDSCLGNAHEASNPFELLDEKFFELLEVAGEHFEKMADQFADTG